MDETTETETPEEGKSTDNVEGDAPNVVVLNIVYNMKTSEINCDGPLLHKGLCYQMLEMAKDTIRDFHYQKRAEAQAKRIVPATQMPQGRPQ
jgi:hypothetical protein